MMDPDLNQFVEVEKVSAEMAEKETSQLAKMLERCKQEAGNKMPYDEVAKRIEEEIQREIQRNVDRRIEEAAEYRTKEGKPVPDNATIFELGEEIELKGYIFKVASMKGDSLLLRGLRPAPETKYKRKNGPVFKASKKKNKSGSRKGR